MADISYGWENSVYTDNTDLSEINFSFKSKNNKTKSIFIKLLIVIFSVLFVAEIVYYFLILPAKANALIKISGCINLSSLEVKEVAGLTNKSKWLSVNSSLVSKKLVSYPLISSASVQKRFPDKIVINIVEREAVAIAFTEINGITIPMEIDKYGVVFKIGRKNINSNLPIITGLTFKKPTPGMRVNPQLINLFVQLDMIQKKEPLLLNEISEIKISPKKYGGFDLLIYPIKSKLSILSNKVLTEESLRYMLLLIDVVKDIGMDSEIVQIDIRGSNAVYKKRSFNND